MDSASSLSRRSVLRVMAGAALAAVPAIGLANSASAGRAWCRADPTFRVDGLVGNVWVAGELNRKYDTTGPIQLHFIMPPDTTVELLAQDNGFGQGYEISYHFTERLKKDHKKIELEIKVLVPTVSDKLPVLIEFVPDGTIEIEDDKTGKSNEWLKVKTQLRKPKETKEEKEARKAVEKEAKEAEKAAKKDQKAQDKAAEDDSGEDNNLNWSDVAEDDD